MLIALSIAGYVVLWVLFGRMYASWSWRTDTEVARERGESPTITDARFAVGACFLLGGLLWPVITAVWIVVKSFQALSTPGSSLTSWILREGAIVKRRELAEREQRIEAMERELEIGGR